MNGLKSIDDETLKALISNQKGYHIIYASSLYLTDEQLKFLDNKPEQAAIY